MLKNISKVKHSADIIMTTHVIEPCPISAKQCPVLKDIENGLYLTRRAQFHFGDSVTLQCMDGYYITGWPETTVNQAVECTDTGVWSHNLTCSGE